MDSTSEDGKNGDIVDEAQGTPTAAVETALARKMTPNSSPSEAGRGGDVVSPDRVASVNAEEIQMQRAHERQQMQARRWRQEQGQRISAATVARGIARGVDTKLSASDMKDLYDAGVGIVDHGGDDDMSVDAIRVEGSASTLSLVPPPSLVTGFKVEEAEAEEESACSGDQGAPSDKDSSTLETTLRSTVCEMVATSSSDGGPIDKQSGALLAPPGHAGTSCEARKPKKGNSNKMAFSPAPGNGVQGRMGGGELSSEEEKEEESVLDAKRRWADRRPGESKGRQDERSNVDLSRLPKDRKVPEVVPVDDGMPGQSAAAQDEGPDVARPEKVPATIPDGEASFATFSENGGASHLPSPAGEIARPETVSATAPSGRIFERSMTGNGRVLASTGDADRGGTTDGSGEDLTTPGAVAVRGLEEESAAPSSTSSSRDESTPRIFEGTLVDPRNERKSERVSDGVRERVYEGTPVPSVKAADGTHRGLLKHLLTFFGLLCIVAAIVALAVTLSGQQSTTESGAYTQNSFPTTSTAPSVSDLPSCTPSSIPTNQPSSHPSLDDVLILNHLENVFGNRVHGESSPYANATEWILSEDSTGPANRMSEFLTQRYVLALLYYSTNGKNWRAKRFLTPDHHCSWYRIGCNNDESVHSIRMWDNNLEGTLPSELALIQSLRILDFTRNNIEGTIPSEIGRLTQLRELHLTSDVIIFDGGYREPQGRLSGSLPSSIGNLSRLEVLALSGNEDLGGTLPEEFYRLESLVAFYADSTSFSGVFSQLIDGINDHLIHLEVFFIRGNEFTGRIPTSIGIMKSLEILHVSDNELTGTLPEELYGMESLTYLDLSFNALNGSISPLIGRLSNLEDLYIDGNSFDGTIPATIGNITSLAHLLVGGNDLSGPLPDELYELESLTLLDLNNNALTGTISSRVGQLNNLEGFSIYNNLFSGTIPAELAEIDTIKLISVFWNDFTGTLSGAFCELDELEWFRADCGPTNRTGPPAVECECCTVCCDTAQRYDYWDTCEYVG
uniref:Leucine-rich repeat-containing N-terminal plant-type domain-containing protein n=1 Tax=Pseudictyota dubia TaxID=2749911 RepID=A0A7R9W3P0_9STRA|mmetsp:Transcript_30860/g.57100  ORF Transcript_30860/g.57100 Transcript_30860/m.57100 type:complete len:1018 (+) Transcript_30860:300-3353(+)|eukprot:CAMPEP_0197445988 /NCGR_PEP_ID=MMETSP1175-20131217/11059_1 /TAXON_ID=1003142 /ORGANISM="Triceratium dubium, Strain CCMP147" /LENGTH=1017 /DNA_ID=CAMNT_0042977041 /DNA_START=299 /DNA_END=3352 /DNA_ORIENTATION=-